jgi:hypothetical protein
MVQMHENIVGLDAAILMHPTTGKHPGTSMRSTIR